ncbi:MAG: hypothetical protein IH852_07350 [Bacteroidetes bacterium]|nr:hypothetical protein [Bacteroidota bacterium]
MEKEIKRIVSDYVIVGGIAGKPNLIVIEQGDYSVALDIDQIGLFVKQLEGVAKEMTERLIESEEE